MVLKKTFLLFLSVLFFGQNQLMATRKTTLAIMDLSSSNIPVTDAKIYTDYLLDQINKLDKYDIIEMEKRNEILREMKFAQSGAYDESSCLIDAGKMLSSDKIVGGTVGKTEDGILSVNIRLIDILTGKIEKSAANYIDGKKGTFFLLVKKSVGDIMDENVLLKDEQEIFERSEKEINDLMAKKQKEENERKLKEFRERTEREAKARKEELKKKENGHVFTKWWFWGCIGAFGAGTYYLINGIEGKQTESNEITPEDNSIPGPPIYP